MAKAHGRKGKTEVPHFRMTEGTITDDVGASRLIKKYKAPADPKALGMGTNESVPHEDPSTPKGPITDGTNMEVARITAKSMTDA